jgi:hypothetical protein
MRVFASLSDRANYNPASLLMGLKPFPVFLHDNMVGRGPLAVFVHQFSSNWRDPRRRWTGSTSFMALMRLKTAFRAG